MKRSDLSATGAGRNMFEVDSDGVPRGRSVRKVNKIRVPECVERNR